MAEYDKGRYYWIKLTDRFMTSDTVDFLMSQKDGANYVVLYQMLCLKTVNNNGVMARQLGEMIVPYDVDKIQRDCKWFSIDTVRIALELYKKLGLIYENNDGILAISNFDRMIGSQTYGAEKKELQKARGGTKVENFPPDKEIKRLRDKENKEKDIDSNIKMYNQILDEFEFSEEVKLKFVEWLEYKKEKKQSYKKKGFEAFCKQRMEEVNNYGDRYVIDMIDYSMCQNYSGLYPPKNNAINPITSKSKSENATVKTYFTPDLENILFGDDKETEE
jgi:hypothetical protein